jgi:hypothetical protein
MKTRGDTLVLENDEKYVKFTRLLAKAVSEGRIDGRYRCQVCGMRYKEEKESYDCCVRVPRH